MASASLVDNWEGTAALGVLVLMKTKQHVKMTLAKAVERL